MFVHLKIDTISELNSDDLYQFNLNGKCLENCKVFYRHANTRENLPNSPWVHDQTMPANQPFKFKNDGYYEFFLSALIETKEMEISEYLLTKIPPKRD